MEQIDRMIISQQRALEELRLESQDLYAAAIEMDPDFLPFSAKGPTETPAVPGYILDGDYVDKTQKFQVQYADMDKFMVELLNRGRRRRKKGDEEQ